MKLKTGSLLFLTSLTFYFAYEQGRLHWIYLKNLSSWAGFFLGFFTLFIGMSLVHLMKSKKIMDFFFSFLMALFLGLLCFNTHSSLLLVEAPQKWTRGGGYCSEAETQESSDSNNPAPGCELIERAYKIGLITDRSSCDIKVSSENMEPCKRRQHDEPLIHYSARLFMEFFDKMGSSWRQSVFWKKTSDIFLTKLSHGKTLVRQLARVLKGEPKASHHIFTNLPAPQLPYSNEHCITQYKRLSPILKLNSTEESTYSQTLNHIYGQLLFDPQFSGQESLCQEYKIHWNSPKDSCQQLAKNPEAFLKENGLWTSIEKLFTRNKEILNLKIMQYKLRYIITGVRELPPPAPPPPGPTEKKPEAYPTEESIISFQCLILDDAIHEIATFKEVSFLLNNHSFMAREVRFPRQLQGLRIQMEMYKHFAQAMAGTSFQYESSMTKESKDAVRQWHIDSAFFSKGDYPLTRLEFLKQTDIFYGNNWLQERSDLLEIYPYYHHMNYFINLFRDEYHSQRTRL